MIQEGIKPGSNSIQRKVRAPFWKLGQFSRKLLRMMLTYFQPTGIRHDVRDGCQFG